MSCRVELCEVSEIRTGQAMRIFQLAPSLLSKGEGQLIGRKGEQVGEFAHQIGFRQSLGRKREDSFTTCSYDFTRLSSSRGHDIR